MQPTIGSSNNRAAHLTRGNIFIKKVTKLTCQNTQLRQLMGSISSRKLRINVVKVRCFCLHIQSCYCKFVYRKQSELSIDDFFSA